MAGYNIFRILPMPKVVALDFETANYPRESAIALGVSVIEDGIIRGARSWLFRPPGERIYIREDFIKIHGIRPADLRDKPYFHGVWPEIEACLQNADLIIAHNVGFDRSVLHAVANHYSIDLPRFNWQCTVNIARAAWPGLVNHKLPTVCEHLGIPLRHHDPASDAIACAKIFLSSESVVPERAVAAGYDAGPGGEAPELGIVMSQYRLGIRYCDGQGVAQNYAKALNLLRKAAEQGHAEAQCRLGDMYDRGEGVSPSVDDALKWYRAAAEQGNEQARQKIKAGL